jgi:hypothetical protein
MYSFCCFIITVRHLYGSFVADLACVAEIAVRVVNIADFTSTKDVFVSDIDVYASYVAACVFQKDAFVSKTDVFISHT